MLVLTGAFRTSLSWSSLFLWDEICGLKLHHKIDLISELWGKLFVSFIVIRFYLKKVGLDYLEDPIEILKRKLSEIPFKHGLDFSGKSFILLCIYHYDRFPLLNAIEIAPRNSFCTKIIKFLYAFTSFYVSSIFRFHPPHSLAEFQFLCSSPKSR